MQKHVNFVDLAKSFPTNIFLQNLASIQKRTSPIKFGHLAETSDEGSISNLSTKVSGQRKTFERQRSTVGEVRKEHMEKGRGRIHQHYLGVAKNLLGPSAMQDDALKLQVFIWWRRVVRTGVDHSSAVA